MEPAQHLRRSIATSSWLVTPVCAICRPVSRQVEAPLEWPELTPEEIETLDRFHRAQERLDQGLIRPEQTAKTPERSLARWEARLDEMRSFLKACGEPQKAYKSVHVTGTSGKGSVATIIAGALHRAGYSVGLHTSPYLQTPTEKNWINGKLLSADAFADLVDWVWPVAFPRKTPENPASIHGMASVAMAFEAFKRAEVEVAVIEAGCGGRFDLTNKLDPSVTVVTSVGRDHILSLGPTVEDIAWHKAGIFKRGAPAITGATGAPVEVLREEARSLDVELTEIPPNIDAPFWETNAHIARAAVEALKERFVVPSWAIDEAMEIARLAARREVVPEPSRTVILDGAHNPDKMAALVRTLDPGAIFVIGCLSAKDMKGLVEPVTAVADKVITTEPRVYLKPPTPAETLAQAFADSGLEAIAEPNPCLAMERAIEGSSPEQTIVATGSLYLVGQLRERWFPTERVILQQTSWPVRPS